MLLLLAGAELFTQVTVAACAQLALSVSSGFNAFGGVGVPSQGVGGGGRGAAK